MSRLHAMQDEFNIVISSTVKGLMPLTISDIKNNDHLTIVLRANGAAYLCLESINYLIDQKEIATLKIIRDVLFALPLSKEESTTCRQ